MTPGWKNSAFPLSREASGRFCFKSCKPMKQCNHLFIGAGPAGLFSALSAAERGKRVVMLEKMERPGIKLLLSGSGQCNITRGGPMEDFFRHYGDNHRFLKHALLSFTNNDLMDYFGQRGLEMLVREDGKVFPGSLRSRDVLDVLLHECERAGVEILYGKKVLSLEKVEGYFRAGTGDETWQAPTVLIAAGGKSYPSTGSSGDGYTLASGLGHTIITPRPSLVSLEIKNFPFGDLAGISITGSFISLHRQGKRMREHRGDILFTHTGLSGPGILDFSRYMQPGDEVSLSMTAMENREEFRGRIMERMGREPAVRMRMILNGENIPSRLTERLLELGSIDRDARVGEVRKELKNKFVDALTGTRLQISDTGGFDRAMCTAGGVTLKEIQPRTMESRIVPGLYFAGEVMDIDGDTGGYNLQAAFSTAFIAGNAMRGKYSR
ncbi:MAG: NAD(P)/FAD-dependent oxidoreductase [Spirochaetae bacterium HGW-Spirochaetae-1]|nr:MAG: NAD(P)/FAD-dependent oxidoreductase [Spirochaetae bacterium HGW-Spirochaetae-1]